MGINVHRADQPEALARAFASLLREAPADVFTPEVVVVPARGIERWLAQRLSHALGTTVGDDGVCAGLQIMAPQSLISMLLGRERDDPWQADRLVWPTLEAIGELTGSRHFEALTHHLGAGPEIVEDPRAEWERKARQSRRYAVARRIAGLFASYARERPSLLADWEAGVHSDAAGGTLPDDFLWQPILWRRTVDLVRAQHDLAESVIERHQRVADELSSGSRDLDLPPRLSFFGYTRLAASDRELLVALGARRDIHLWLPHPSPQLWTDLAGKTSLGARADDRTAREAKHPLLATLGRDVRELQAVLSTPGVTIEEPLDPTPVQRTDRLALLQADIRANRAPDSTRTTTADDLSIQVHAAHGPARQVEVLREVLTWLLAEGQGTLQPRDILVMCPDIETFAPLIQATFGLTLVPTAGRSADPYHPGQQLRVQLADRALGATNPLIDLAHRVVRVVAGRMTVSEVLDLASHEAVRARFGFDEERLARVSRWVADAGVRWGYDAGHRAEYQLADLDANTWTRGMDRIALGVAVAADSDAPSSARVPVDDIGSRDIEVVGHVLELMERLKRAADTVRGTLSVREWMRWLQDTIEALADTPPDERWQFAQLARDLDAIGDAAGEGATLRLNDIRVLLDQRWGARATRANFRSGAITVCTMVPMRSVPHKAVVVLGVDDGVYPRSPVVDGDDVIARSPRVGERDLRSEDRQLLLDAVMAAGESFVAIYSGFDEHNGNRRPPAVPLQELIAAASRTATTPDDPPDGSGDPSFVRHHPLQAFDERNFRPDGPVPGGTFDTAALAGAEALRVFRTDPPAPTVFLDQPLPVRPTSAVTVEELVAFLQNPAREFLRHRLDVTVPREVDETNDSLPIALDGLEQWDIGERVLHEVLDGMPLEDALDREAVRGTLPPGALGQAARADIAARVTAIAADRGSDQPRSVDIRLDLPTPEGGEVVRMTGVVGAIHDNTARDDTVWVRTYSTISAKHVAAAWVRLLALAVAEPAREHRAELIGKRGGLRLASPSPADAQALLADLVQARQSGLRFPMGIAPKTASAYAAAYRRTRPGDPYGVPEALERARGSWEGNQRIPGENDDPWWRLVLGPQSRVEELNRLRGLEYFGPRVWNPIHEHGGEA
ncbi:DNA helicase/exodeoxyribonuclease V gamma subunit [Mumia flava]|uniref:RecBCD enzyme subunit RecC n=1 Tax=Mumia flava TaxID=1348852 RepID=A0A0B2BM03_9ACTN|nr:exodeoxyribonuclease V subunit gamma [Mumia flava]PJJ54396.1 DNA helicase/exodeoxyribonuclease V gamma subunit [Mumia flava]